MFSASHKVLLDNSISEKKRREVIENRLNNLGYFTKIIENKIHFSGKSNLYKHRFAYSYLVFGVSNRGIIYFKDNEIKCEFPLYTQFIGQLALVIIFISIFRNKGDHLILYISIFSFIVFAIAYLIVRTRNFIAAQALLKRLMGIS